MKFRHAMLVSISAALVAASPALMAGGSVAKKSDVVWKDMGNGITAAQVSGDMQKGASRFYLKYPVGLVTPLHHHNTDHYGTIVSGRVTLTVDGKDHKLGPGDYFALTNKAPHAAKVEGKEAVVFFIQADAPWDVVMEK